MKKTTEQSLKTHEQPADLTVTGGGQGGNGRLSASSKRNPCPICGREKDGSCSISQNAEVVHCHQGQTHQPPTDKLGEVIRIGEQRWRCGGPSSGRSDAVLFNLLTDPIPSNGHKPRPVSRPAKRSPAPAPITGPIVLARLDGATTEATSPYIYSETQRVLRNDKSGRKTFACEHLDGQRWSSNAGPDPWPVWREADALAAAGWILELEGEKCVEIARSGGLVAISQPGHAHKVDQIRSRYSRLRAAGVAGVVFVKDHDEQGTKRAEEAAQAAAAEGLPFLILDAAAIWPGIPSGGSIDDAPGTPAERIQALEAALLSPPEAPEQGQEREISAQRGGGKRLRLAPDEVLAGLPPRIGRARLNVRSGDVHTDNLGVLSGNAISRLYLRLSDHAETWPKDSTVDAVAELASADPFDPVADYLEAITVPALPLKQWRRLDQHLLGIDDPIAAAFLPRYLISAVARTFEPGCGVRQSPVLIGPQQRGKTAMGQILFGAPLYVEGVKDLGRDAQARCHTAWGVELAELNGITRRADQEALKAFLTETADVYRTPYDKAPERHPRRFVFWGTSNGPPLRDLSGSTRFVCIPIPDRMLPLDWAIANRDALWARAVEQYRAGVPWDRTTEEERAAVAERNLDHQEIDPWADRVAAFLDERRRSGELPVRLPEVLDRLEVPTERQTNAMASRARGLAEAMGWTWERRWVNKKEGIRRRGMWPPLGGHPGTAQGHPGDTPTKSSDTKAFALGDTPGHPYSERDKKKRGGEGEEVEGERSNSATPGGFEPFGVSPVSPRGNLSDTKDSQPTAGVSPGCPLGVSPASPRTVPPITAPVWLPDLERLATEQPNAAAATLALALDPAGLLGITGRAVKPWLDQLRAA